jgi:integrase/recombinase XerC
MLLNDHLEHLRQSGYTTTSIYARSRALIRLAAVLPVPLIDADAAMLAAWRAAMTVTDGVIASYVCHAREFYRWAVTAGLRDDNPAAKLPIPRTGRRLPRPVGEPDLMRALALAGPRIRPWLVLAGWCGLRAKEIAYLKRESIMETVMPPVLLVATDATKGRTERVVPLCAFAVAELAAAGLPASGYAFRRADGRPGCNEPWMISHMCNEHLHGCGISETLHQLRHRFGTMTYRATHDLRAVQELMGHASPVTTAGYAAFDSAGALAAVESLPVPSPCPPDDIQTAG